MKQLFWVSITRHQIGEKDMPKTSISVGVYSVHNPHKFKQIVEGILPMNPRNRRIPPQNQADLVRKKLAELGYHPIPNFGELSIMSY